MKRASKRRPTAALGGGVGLQMRSSSTGRSRRFIARFISLAALAVPFTFPPAEGVLIGRLRVFRFFRPVERIFRSSALSLFLFFLAASVYIRIYTASLPSRITFYFLLRLSFSLFSRRRARVHMYVCVHVRMLKNIHV